MSNKQITFLMPRTGEHPIGGFKVVYEYANRLMADGYTVRVVYLIASRPIKNLFVRLAYLTLRYFRYLKYKKNGGYGPDSWFELDQAIEQRLIFLPTAKNIGPTDCLFATAWTTAVWVDKYQQIAPNKKFYLIQALEDWLGDPQDMLQTWKMPLRKLVIAPWLQTFAHQMGQEAVLLPNGLNPEKFYPTIEIEQKESLHVSMLWHDHPLKACPVGLEAIERVRSQLPELQATFFGVPSRPADLPAWIEYHQMPDVETHRKIYNQAAIFVGSSAKEGLGLTVPEAMLCGAAVACTDNDGYKVMAHHEQTALLSEINSPQALADNIIRLIQDNELRHRLAHAAVAFVQPFTWNKSYVILKEQIEQ